MPITKYSLKKYDGTQRRGDARISIQSSGVVRFSSELCRVSNLTAFKYVLLFYDEANRVIAFQFTNTPESGAAKVTVDRNSALIAAKAFFTANKLDLDKLAGQYAFEERTIPGIGRVFVIYPENV